MVTMIVKYCSVMHERASDWINEQTSNGSKRERATEIHLKPTVVVNFLKLNLLWFLIYIYVCIVCACVLLKKKTNKRIFIVIFQMDFYGENKSVSLFGMSVNEKKLIWTERNEICHG